MTPHPALRRITIISGREDSAAHALNPSPYPNHQVGVPPRDGFCGGDAPVVWRVLEGLSQASMKPSKEYWQSIQVVNLDLG